jgi:hypothetical protein
MTDEVRAYLRAVDKTISAPVALGGNGHRLVAEAENRLSALGTFRWVSVGSTQCETSIAGYSDVDMLAVFLPPNPWGTRESILPYTAKELRRALERDNFLSHLPYPPAPGKAFDLVAECLADLGPSCEFDPPTLDFPAVRFSSRTEEPAIEFVPSISADILWDHKSTAPSSGLVRVVFPARRDQWKGTDAALHSSTLNFGRHGSDYSVRELIRLLKLIKYRHGVPVRSYFLEIFALRWLEGSEEFPAKSIADIIQQHDVAWSFRDLGLLVNDIARLVASLAERLSRAAEGRMLSMVDLTTPEQRGPTVEACEDATQARAAAVLMESIATEAGKARTAVQTRNSSSAIGHWRTILDEVE